MLLGNWLEDVMLPLKLNTDIQGPDGKVGELSRVVVGPTSGDITHVVVHRGMLAGDDLLVPLDALAERDGGLWLDNREDELDSQFPAFDPASYREPDPDYTGPPGWDARALGVDNLQLQTYVAMGPLNAFGSGPMLGYAGGERVDADEPLPTTVEQGTDVFDAEGKKVGEVSGFEADPAGTPTRLVVRQGFIFHSNHDIPVGLIDEINDIGVFLSEPRSALKRLAG